jgi:hypothetical protein
MLLLLAFVAFLSQLLLQPTALTADLLRLHAAAGVPDLMTKCLLDQSLAHPAEYRRYRHLLCACNASQAVVAR